MSRAPRRAITDDLLRRVAEIYHLHINHAPTVAVAQRLGVANRTARLYVHRARAAGHLGPSLWGKAGEAPEATEMGA